MSMKQFTARILDSGAALFLAFLFNLSFVAFNVWAGLDHFGWGTLSRHDGDQRRMRFMAAGVLMAGER